MKIICKKCNKEYFDNFLKLTVDGCPKCGNHEFTLTCTIKENLDKLEILIKETNEKGELLSNGFKYDL